MKNCLFCIRSVGTFDEKEEEEEDGLHPMLRVVWFKLESDTITHTENIFGYKIVAWALIRSATNTF